MARPKTHRLIHTPPLYKGFKPIGVMGRDLVTLEMSLDEYEAIRLADYLGLDHTEAAQEMGISRSTFSRLIEKARQKTAQFFIEGKELCIEGGNIHFLGNVIRCHECGHMFNIDIGQSVSKCPECHSAKLVNLAGGFGHGRCCATRHLPQIGREKRWYVSTAEKVSNIRSRCWV